MAHGKQCKSKRHIYISDEACDRADIIAKSEGRSRSNYIEELIRRAYQTISQNGTDTQVVAGGDSSGSGASNP